DGLRAVAIALVYGFHDQGGDLLAYLASWVEIALLLLIDLPLEAVGLPTVSFRAKALLTRPFYEDGWVGVQVFFVLSGFLITTLLLRERERFGRIDLRAFWVRRALRIWPLYYLIVAIGFGIIPRIEGAYHTEFGPLQAAESLPPFLVFLGN